MTNFTLTTGDDTFNGTSSADTFSGPAGGSDVLRGMDGDDIFTLQSGQKGKINGGNGSDTVVAAGSNFGNLNFSNVETLEIQQAGTFQAKVAQFIAFSHIVIDNPSTTTLSVKGHGGTLDFSTRYSGSALTVDATRATSDMIIVGAAGANTILGSHFSDQITGSVGADTITIQGSGEADGLDGNDTLASTGQNATLKGESGDDLLQELNGAAGTTLEGGDGNDISIIGDGAFLVDGGAGTDTVWAVGTAMGNVILQNVEELKVLHALGISIDQLHSFTEFDTGTSGAGQFFLGGNGGTLDFTLGWLSLGGLTLDASGLTSDLTLTATSKADAIRGSNWSDTINGGSGDDTIDGGTGGDVISGGAGDDQITIGGEGSRASGGTGNDLIVDQSQFGNVLGGGDGNDTIKPAGDDTLTGGAGSDTFVYDSHLNSNASNFDRFQDFDPSQDKLDLWFAVTAVDPTFSTTIALTDLGRKNALDATHFAVGHAVIAETGGHHYLIVNSNGIAGYQNGQDLVFQMDNVNSVDVTNFV